MTEETLTTLFNSISEPITWNGLRLRAMAKSRTTIGGRTVIVPLLPGSAVPVEEVGRAIIGAGVGRIMGATGGRLAGAG